MTDTKRITAHPICWPRDTPRTANRKSGHRFQASFQDAYIHAKDELRKFGAIGVVISTDVPLRRDGLPYADGDPDDPGVVVYFTRGHHQYIFTCDLYQRVQWNMRSLGLAFAGMRAIERSGSTQILDRALSGFAQLPSGAGQSPTQRPWREVMNLEGFQGPAFVMRAGLEAAYKQLSRTRHPDAGGSEAAMVELNLAREAALKEIDAL
jgi:hypothetical protein